MHPRYALTCDDSSKEGAYGHVDHHLIYKDHYTAPKLINVAFTTKEKNTINNEFKKTNTAFMKKFLVCYNGLKDSVDKYCIQNYKLIHKFEGYKKMVLLYDENPKGTLALVMTLLEDDDPLAGELITIGQSEEAVAAVLHEVRESDLKEYENATRSPIGVCKTYAKYLLANQFNEYTLTDSPSGDEDKIKIKTESSKIIIEVSSEDDAAICYKVEDVQSNWATALENMSESNGTAFYKEVSVPESGIYVVYITIGGKQYARKVYVR